VSTRNSSTISLSILNPEDGVICVYGLDDDGGLPSPMTASRRCNASSKSISAPPIQKA
jgi:hypothetical protein